jgi:hypothetical protein
MAASIRDVGTPWVLSHISLAPIPLPIHVLQLRRPSLRCRVVPAMNAAHSKSSFLHDQVRFQLQSGQYAPGERIDPAALARHFHTSQTPVRFALYRLVGEGLLDDHAREGFHVPLPTELALRDLYDWMQRLLSMACDIGFPSCAETSEPFGMPKPEDDLVQSTQRLFDNIALATGHLALHRAVQMTNGRLAPLRHAKQGLLKHTFDELSILGRHWDKRNIPALHSALAEYHERRKTLVPQIVSVLTSKAPYNRH